MKKLIYIFISFLGLSLTGQTLKLDNGTYVFEKVDTINLNKREIYDKTRKWVARNFRSSDNNIVLNDTSNSQLSTSGNLFLNNFNVKICSYINLTLNFKFTVLAKEGRYKVIFDNMIFGTTAVCYLSSGASNQYHEYPLEKWTLVPEKKEELLKEIEEKMLKLCIDLNQTLNNTNPKNNNDW